ncbi:MAG: HlyD family efflux transporter periplasmic adaptor subunit [Planctomycetota bacterium]|nr:HlyD family efflux transporter periplasmic adaptor subunit [Planctomycetota bacterium]
MSRPHTPPTPPRRRRLRFFVTLTVVVGALTATAYTFRDALRPSAQAPEVLTYQVARGPFLHEIIAGGEIESSRNVEVLCRVKSRNSSATAIIDVIPEGSQVKEGDVLLRLDSSAHEQDRFQQQIVLNNSQAAMIQAKNALEAARITRKEFLEGIYVQEEQAAKNEITLAEENVRRARQYAKHSELLASRGYVTALQLEGDQFAVEKAEGILSAAQTKLKVLQEYRKEKALMTLDSEIRSAEARAQSAESSYQLELNRMRDIETQIANCTIVAPQSGQVVYANNKANNSSNFVVEPGAIVRERQAIIRLPDPAFMQVDATIHESRVTLIDAGMPVTISLESFPELQLTGCVSKVNEYPEPTNFFGSQVKKYAASVTINDPPANLRAGLTAEVRIQVDAKVDALQVPVQAIHEHGKKYYCFVRLASNWAAREVAIDASNDKFIVVSSGLHAGDVVAMDPLPLLNFVSLPEITTDPANPAPIVAHHPTVQSKSTQEPVSTLLTKKDGGA